MEDNLKAQQAKEKVNEMISKLDNNKTNVAMNKRGEGIPLWLFGYSLYNHLGKYVNINELNCFDVENWTITDGPTKGLKIVKTVENKRLEGTVEKALTDWGKTFVGLSISKKAYSPKVHNENKWREHKKWWVWCGLQQVLQKTSNKPWCNNLWDIERRLEMQK
jgi:hypothetical protein